MSVIVPIEVLPAVDCSVATSQYATVRALLEYYDSNNDGVITKADATQAVIDRQNNLLTTDEGVHVVLCYQDYGGVITKYCNGVSRDVYFDAKDGAGALISGVEIQVDGVIKGTT